jgi:organic hydroperoxide reductase OsmC/OhrA
MSTPESFPIAVEWHGSTAKELAEDYSRNATALAEDKPAISVSAGAAYGGDPSRWNPEDLLASSLATCHLLTFLALAKKNGIDVRSYVGAAVAVLGAVEGKKQVTEITLSPTITLGVGDLETAKTLFEKAHKYCFIASSIRAKVVMIPTFVQ